jgi:hypothetical protein
MSQQICKVHEETLILVAAGVADAGSAGLLRAHVEECETCRAELERLKRILSAIGKEDLASAKMAPPQSLHTDLMKCLRAEPREQAETPRAITWVEGLKSLLRSRRTAWGLVALGAVGVVILLPARWVRTDGRINSGGLATSHNDKPSELKRFGGQPAGPAELRRSLVHSFEDFEFVLRRNDRLLAMREPLAVPSNARPDKLEPQIQ